MTLEEKIKQVQILKEDELREKILIPLFSKMGFLDPILHHHSNEKGKDIVIKEYDPKFKKITYIAVVVKAGDVNGSASSSSSYFALLNQVKQAFNEPYKHIYELKEVNIDQVIIVISGRFLPTSLDSIYNTLKAERLDKAIKEPIDINRLPELIDEYFPEYWNEYENEHKSLLTQRNNLLNNFSKLSKVLFPGYEDQEKFLNSIPNNEYDINILPFDSIVKYVADISYKKINIDEIDEYYTDTTISNDYCDIKSYFFEIKEKAKKVLYEMDDVVELLKSILTEKNPSKIVEMTMELNSYVGGYGFGSRGFNFSTQDVEFQEDFGYALNEYTNKKNLLIEKDILKFYQSLIIAIKESIVAPMANFYQEYPKNYRNMWLGMKVKFNLDTKELTSLEYYKFEKEPQILEKDTTFRYQQREIERSSINDNYEINVEYALNNYGFGLKDEDLSAEVKAKKFSWNYSKTFPDF
jgi:hypothetical protein